MLARTQLDPQEALVCTMVLVAAAETGGITDREIGVMATLVKRCPSSSASPTSGCNTPPIQP
jgi:hypothetical protein